jgi:hypothetical protein
MGSGKVILRAIEKYGTNNFKKEILEYFDSSEAMFAREKEIVTEEFLARKDTYNLRRGGFGGFDHINKNKNLLIERNRKIAKKRNYKDKIYLTKLGKAISIGKIDSHKPNNFPLWTGKKHSLETRKKMSTAHKGKCKKELNSQFGTKWITNENINAKIKNTDPIPIGWRKGRIMGTQAWT